MRSPAISILVLSVLGLIPASAADAPLEERVRLWEQKAYYCSVFDRQFPSKEPVEAGASCDDGDMTLFNGLLCAAGDPRGCVGVSESQDDKGRWWRSPRRIGIEASSNKNKKKDSASFSRDQSLGVLLYVVQAKNALAFKRWLAWMGDNRPDIFTKGDRLGLLRYCRDDWRDKACTVTPPNCALIRAVGLYLNVDTSLCRQALNGVFDFFDLSPEAYAALAAIVNKSGYSNHTVAVQMLLLTRLGAPPDITRPIAEILQSREPRNPFFAYLAEGATERVDNLVLELCPAPDRLSRRRYQWAWERTDSDLAWKDSMYWDCIFMAKLLRDSASAQ